MFKLDGDSGSMYLQYVMRLLQIFFRSAPDAIIPGFGLGQNIPDPRA
jgi:hypothetical protein